MELMEKSVKDGGAIGVEDLDRWSPGSVAVKFLAMTTSATSVNELKEVNKFLSIKVNLTLVASASRELAKRRSPVVCGSLYTSSLYSIWRFNAVLIPFIWKVYLK